MPMRSYLKSIGLCIGLVCTVIFNPSYQIYAQNPLPEEQSGPDATTEVERKEVDPVVNPQERDTVIPPQEADTGNVGPKLTDSVVSPRETDNVIPAPVSLVGEPKEADGQLAPIGLILGFRTGLSIPTQKVIQDFGNSTSIGPIINVEALYALREWVRVGLMLEWHRHSIKQWGPDFGTLNIVSILPTVEFRPTREAWKAQGIEAFVPYASLGLGVNSNSFSEASRLGNSSVSFHDTFALRVAGGIDFPITSHLALNGEVAWNRNSGGYQLNATDGSFNASTLNLLVGLRAQF